MASENDAEYYINDNPTSFPKNIKELEGIRTEAFNAGLNLRKLEDEWQHGHRRRELATLREKMICDMISKSVMEHGAGSEGTRRAWLVQIDVVVDSVMKYLIETESKTYV